MLIVNCVFNISYCKAVITKILLVTDGLIFHSFSHGACRLITAVDLSALT